MERNQIKLIGRVCKEVTYNTDGQFTRLYLKTHVDLGKTPHLQHKYDVHRCFVFGEPALLAKQLKEQDFIEVSGSLHYDLKKSDGNLLPISKVYVHELINHSARMQLIQEQIKPHSKAFYLQLFGTPKEARAHELIYSGGLHIAIDPTDPKCGQWFSFVDQKGGGVLQAIQRVEHCDLMTAMQLAETWLQKEPHSPDVLTLTAPKQKKLDPAERIEKARMIWRKSKAIAGTLGETYLKDHRGIPGDLDRMSFRFLPAFGKVPPAVVLAAENPAGEIMAIQRIFLDPATGNKQKTEGDAKNPSKISTGVLLGSAGIVQRGQPGGRIYIVEGPEKGAAIAYADSSATVLAAFSVGNMQNLAELVLHLMKVQQTKAVFVAGDNEPANAAATSALCQAVAELMRHDIQPKLLFPTLPNAGLKKVDYDDVLKHAGVEVLRAQLQLTKKEVSHVLAS